MIGDSLSDIEGVRKACMLSIDYPHNPGKLDCFTTAGADAVITSVEELLPHPGEHQAVTD